MTTSVFAMHADLYQSLAEALFEPPEWMALPGRQWPLFEAAARLAPLSPAAGRAVARLAEVSAEIPDARRARYASLFAGPGRPPHWLYESAALNGHLPGPETFAVEKLYRAAGLHIIGAELPDHASLELAFLAFLAQRQAEEDNRAAEWREIERCFIERHAGRWLPELGRALARSLDEVYAPIGQLLADWLEEKSSTRPVMHDEERGNHAVAHHAPVLRRQPTITHPEVCTLCGFCVQVCPTGALVIRETENETALLLRATACVSCGRCETSCQHNALLFASFPQKAASQRQREALLRTSPRARCPSCGASTISQAELDFVARQLDHPLWLAYCLACRPRIEIYGYTCLTGD